MNQQEHDNRQAWVSLAVPGTLPARALAGEPLEPSERILCILLEIPMRATA